MEISKDEPEPPSTWAPATTLNHSDLPTFQIWPRCLTQHPTEKGVLET